MAMILKQADLPVPAASAGPPSELGGQRRCTASPDAPRQSEQEANSAWLSVGGPAPQFSSA